MDLRPDKIFPARFYEDNGVASTPKRSSCRSPGRKDTRRRLRTDSRGSLDSPEGCRTRRKSRHLCVREGNGEDEPVSGLSSGLTWQAKPRVLRGELRLLDCAELFGQPLCKSASGPRGFLQRP